MRLLPERPDLDQLRRQAKELHRAAAAGSPGAERRLRRVSTATSLAAAQLALAREYGFPSWARLKAEVDRRRAPSNRRPTLRTELRTWSGMRDWMASLLERRTGQNVEAWNRRIQAARIRDQAGLRRWLNDQGVTGYAHRLLVWERFGYPKFMKAGIGDLIGMQYADRPRLRPVLDAVLGVLPEISPVFIVQARKTYVSLVSGRRTFAVVQATTRNRVDLGLRLAKATAGGRLQSARGVGNGSMTVKLGLTSPEDLDAEAIAWLKRAYEENA
jgi:Domain of unknown function (DUF5655)